jgi:hypothetical protein
VRFDRNARWWTALTAALAAVAWIATAGLATPASAHRLQAAATDSLVGAWYVDTIGAPFEPHGITFHADQTLDLTNPDAAEANNSSSAGMGEWRRVTIAGQPAARGAFFEVNADKTTNQFTTILVVRFEVRLSALQPGTFSGPATATYYDGNRNVVAGPFDAVLKGQRFGPTGPVPDPLNF